MLQRLHAAGLCAAVFDSIFFSTEHVLEKDYGFSAPAAYGCAAAAAVVCGFVPDTTVARMLVVPPSKPVKVACACCCTCGFSRSEVAVACLPAVLLHRHSVSVAVAGCLVTAV